MSKITFQLNTFNLPRVGGKLPREFLVLIVEDHDDTRFFLRWLLERRGYRVAEAIDGVMAVKMAEREKPALILMDVGLPRLSGIAATQLIRTKKHLRGVPIVFLSAHVMPAQQALALAAGGNEYLIKPIDIEDFEYMLARYLVTHTESSATAERTRREELR